MIITFGLEFKIQTEKRTGYGDVVVEIIISTAIHV